jgi:hypothetical protein
MKVANCGESSTKSNCDSIRNLMMKHRYINEKKLSPLTQDEPWVKEKKSMGEAID